LPVIAPVIRRRGSPPRHQEHLRMAAVPTLELVGEAKIARLMGCSPRAERWEASGVLVKDGYCFVAFDDRTQIGRFASDLQPGEAHGLCGLSHSEGGYEGITYNAVKHRFYLLVEAREPSCQACIVEYDDEFRFVKERPLDFTFESSNKGFEAVAHVRRDDEDYLLALCEGNKCKCGKKGRTPGGGRVQVFVKKRSRWRHADTIALPATLPFVDYSGMSIDQGRVAVVSQVNSMLWVGQFNEADWTWRDAGQLYEFPRSDQGTIRYGNIEGVGWLSPTRIVTVSDRRKKKSQPDKSLSEKDQSIHIFDLRSQAPRPAGLGDTSDE
jgi:hypothetical protein